MQVELTPKVLANFSPGLERSDNLGLANKNKIRNPERVLPTAEPFQGLIRFQLSSPGLSLRSNRGLELANAFGVNSYHITTRRIE